MKLAATFLALGRADLWSAKWNPFSSPSACTPGLNHFQNIFYPKFVDKVDLPDFGGSCLEGTDCCFLCPDPIKEEYKVPVISCGDKFAPNGCATTNGEGCECEPLLFVTDADVFSGKDLLTNFDTVQY